MPTPTRSLNPNAAENVAQRLAGNTPRPEPPRRNFLYAFAAVVVGAIVGLFPVGAGLLTFLDPILRKKKNADDADKGKLLRVASVDNVPADGTPVQVPVIADLVDAWSGEPNQPIGAVYLRRDSEGKIICYNAICPHAGCFVGFDAGRRCFQCPCHTSAFELSGESILPSPSPRDMDPLEVDADKLKQGEIWINFQNYYPGKADREAKS